MAPSEAVLSLINRHFKNRAEVEISRNDQCFSGSWYHGTVLRVYKTSRTALVLYDTLMEEGIPLKEEVDLVQLRPAQPDEERHEYAINDCVDVYKRDGWWEGVVIDFHAEKNAYVVFCKHSRVLRTCKVSRLRLHREWVYGNWHPELNAVPVRPPKMEVPAAKKRKMQPQNDSSTSSKDVSSDTQSTYSPAEMLDVPSCAETSTKYTPNRKEAKSGFKPGQPVEVRSDDEGFKGAWFPATVVQTLNTNKYRIKYDYFTSEDGKSKLIEKAHGENMRPCPPKVERVCFNHLEIVDAFYNDCWWAGAIVRVLQDDEYIVYFKTTDEEIKFNHSQLREHGNWINDEWVKTVIME